MTFSVGAGELLTIVGPSGAGKSTLLNIIAQIDTASAGEIVFDGELITGAEQKVLHPGLNRRIGYVTQDDNLLPWRTTAENVLFPIEVQGRLNGETRAHVETLIRAVGLAGFERYYPHELSGGMRKRAALARALALDPELLFLDEPTAGLDPQSASGIDELVRSLSEGLRLTIMMVTHDLDLLWHTAHRVAVLGHGRIVGLGTMAELAQSDDETVRQYFHGPRGRAALEQAWKTK
jgi:ABC-type transporter Mla maintaining outer membrane lipid asymmetry ATPase subunit MlaF